MTSCIKNSCRILKTVKTKIMDIQVRTRKYVLSEEYTDNEGNKKVVKVILVINEADKTFDVLPGDNQSTFRFSSPADATQYAAKWVAVAKLIYSATSFAAKDLGIKIED
jgi:hypothetical protein